MTESKNDTSAIEKSSKDFALEKLKADERLVEFDSAIGSSGAFAHYWRVAKLFAESNFIPEHFRGKPGECFIAISTALRLQEDPLNLMQNSFVVNGRPGWSTSFMISRANQNANFQSKIRWEIEHLSPARLDGKGRPVVEGDGYKNVRVTAHAIDQNGDRIEAEVDTEMAISEGWTRNQKYRSMLTHMMKFRSAAFLIRLHCPEVMMGSTVEELETMPVAETAPPMRLSLGSGGREVESYADLNKTPTAGEPAKEPGKARSEAAKEPAPGPRSDSEPKTKPDAKPAPKPEAKPEEKPKNDAPELGVPMLKPSKIASLRRQAEKLAGMDEGEFDRYIAHRFKCDISEVAEELESEILREIQRRAQKVPQK